jgi:hypothetical protein
VLHARAVKCVRTAALLLLLGACRTPFSDQRDYARTLKPAEVSGGRAQPAAPLSRALRVRVYADGDYRRQTPRWEQRIEAQFERASEVTEKQFGVRLQVESIRPWERASSAVQLDPVFGELAMKDAGAGVDWVVGSSLRSTWSLPRRSSSAWRSCSGATWCCAGCSPPRKPTS